MRLGERRVHAPEAAALVVSVLLAYVPVHALPVMVAILLIPWGLVLLRGPGQRRVEAVFAPLQHLACRVDGARHVMQVGKQIF